MKSLFTVVAGGTALAGFFLLVVLAALFLVVIPAGLGILSLELERLKRGLRHPFAQGRGKLRGGPPFD